MANSIGIDVKKTGSYDPKGSSDMKRITILLLTAAATIALATSAFAQESPKRMGRNMPAFSDVDLNGDGTIVAEELYQMRAKRMAERAADGGKLKNAANAPSFEDIDTDGNGEVSPDEFTAHQAGRMAKHRQERQGKAGN